MHETEETLQRRALRSSALILLLGDERECLRTARYIYRKYRIPSYTVFPSPTRLRQRLSRLLARPYLSIIESEAQSTFFLAAQARSFFRRSDAGLIPVMVDCTDGYQLRNNETIAKWLTPLCYFTDNKSFEAEPPFASPSRKEEDA